MEIKIPVCLFCGKQMTNGIDLITKETSMYNWQCDCEEMKNLRLNIG